jgi:hypothetical protein
MQPLCRALSIRHLFNSCITTPCPQTFGWTPPDTRQALLAMVRKAKPWNFRTSARVYLSGARPRSEEDKTRRYSMTKFALLGAAAALSTTFATPVVAQAVIQEPAAYALLHSDGNKGIGSAPSLRLEDVVVSRGTVNNMALAPSFRPSTPGKETTTRPWSAPVGHRQPRAADVAASTSVSQYLLDQEEANVDRKISGICRGC